MSDVIDSTAPIKVNVVFVRKMPPWKSDSIVRSESSNYPNYRNTRLQVHYKFYKEKLCTNHLTQKPATDIFFCDINNKIINNPDYQTLL